MTDEIQDQNWITLKRAPLGKMVTLLQLEGSVMRVLGETGDTPKNCVTVDVGRVCVDDPIPMHFRSNSLCHVLSRQDLEDLEAERQRTELPVGDLRLYTR